MPEMDAIEAPDGDRGAPVGGLQALQSTHDFHVDYAPATLRTWRKQAPASTSDAK